MGRQRLLDAGISDISGISQRLRGRRGGPARSESIAPAALYEFRIADPGPAEARNDAGDGVPRAERGGAVGQFRAFRNADRKGAV